MGVRCIMSSPHHKPISWGCAWDRCEVGKKVMTASARALNGLGKKAKLTLLLDNVGRSQIRMASAEECALGGTLYMPIEEFEMRAVGARGTLSSSPLFDFDYSIRVS
jgi:hypothetical protein